MKKVIVEDPVILYEAVDGRKFRKPEDCERYEYLINKWGNKIYKTSYIDDTKLNCYYITCYEDLKEIQEYEKRKEWNYPSILSESFYQFPCWVYVPYSPSGLDHPESIRSIEDLKEEIADTEKLLQKIRDDIVDMESKIL